MNEEQKKQAARVRRELKRVGKVKSFFSRKQLSDLKRKGVVPK